MTKSVLVLTAHDAKKEELLSLIKKHRKEIAELNMVATSGTGQMVHARTRLPVTLLKSGATGGYQQIGALLSIGEVKVAVIFLRDPSTVHANDSEILALLRLCDVHNVPFATNLSTAEALLHFLFYQVKTSDLLEPRQFQANNGRLSTEKEGGILMAK